MKVLSCQLLMSVPASQSVNATLRECAQGKALTNLWSARMDDSPDEAVPEPAAARPHGAKVPTAGALARDSMHGVASGLVPFKAAEAASARRAQPQFEQLFRYGSHAALAAVVFFQ
jgi:hypothetical protein